MDIQDQIEELSLRELNALLASADRRRRDLEHQQRQERDRLDIECIHELPHGFGRIPLNGSVRPWIKDNLERLADEMALLIEDHAKENRVNVRRKFNEGDLIEMLLLNHLPRTSYVYGNDDEQRPSQYFTNSVDENGEFVIDINHEFLSYFLFYRSWTKSHHSRKVREHETVTDLVTAVPFRRDGGADDE